MRSRQPGRRRNDRSQDLRPGRQPRYPVVASRGPSRGCLPRRGGGAGPGRTTPQRRATSWPARRTPNMNKIVAFGLGAAAVVVAPRLRRFSSSAHSSGRHRQAKPDPTATPEPLPRRTLNRHPEAGSPRGSVPLPDRQADDPADRIPPLTVTIPAPGWARESDGGILLKNDRQPPDGSRRDHLRRTRVHRVRRRMPVVLDRCPTRRSPPSMSSWPRSQRRRRVYCLGACRYHPGLVRREVDHAPRPR